MELTELEMEMRAKFEDRAGMMEEANRFELSYTLTRPLKLLSANLFQSCTLNISISTNARLVKPGSKTRELKVEKHGAIVEIQRLGRIP